MSDLLRTAKLLLGLSACLLAVGCGGFVKSSGTGSGSDPAAPQIATQPANQTVAAGQTATFSVAATGTAPLTYQWQKNGASIAGATAAIYTTPATTNTDNSAKFQVLVSNTAGSVTSNSAVLTVSADPAAPTITTQPASQTVTAGQTATFTVVAAGTAPLTYQWQKNGSNVSGATNASFTTPATTSADNSSKYQVVVSNSAGSATSSAAILTVNAAAEPPSIGTQPSNETVTVGQKATFTFAATGTPPLNFQWQRNGSNISGATASSYTTPATTSSDNGAQFQVVVSNTAGSVTSNTATLTVNAASTAPAITSQPANQTVTAGQTATFTVAASGTAPLSYQWQRNGSNISGATASSYTTAATTSSDNGAKFQVVVSNSTGSATSNAATLTVNAAGVGPSVTSQPADQSVTVGQTATFSVAATGTGPLSYQWQKNGANISGGTNSSYTTPATVSSDNGTKFQVIVKNALGWATSNAATLTVNAASVAASIATQPASQTVISGQTATFSVSANGTAPLSYQWQKNGANISGATSSSYTTPATSSSDNGATFDVIVSNAAGSATSNLVTLTVTPSGSVVATLTVSASNPGATIPREFGGISTFNILDNCDMMGTASAPNPIYRQLLKNLIFPGQGFIVTAEDDDAGGGIPASGGPSAAQVGCAAQLYTDMKSAGYTNFNYWNGVPICSGNQTLANEYAQAFLTNMPSGWSPNMVVGNEPDGPCGISYSTYASRFATWTSGIRNMSGGGSTKFMGPQFGGQLPWVDTASDMNPFIEAEHGVLAAAGQHWYSQNGCTGSPTLSYQLSSGAATNASSIISSYVETAHANGTTFRLSEMNSVDCGGRSGISDTFATALWIADAMFNLANVGADGVNIFSDEGDYYDLFGFTSTKAPYHINFVRPEYYGFLVFQQATQNGARLLPVTVSTSSNITGWATVDGTNTVRVLVINKDQSASGEVAVNLSGYGNATLSYLLAPSVSAKTGVTWQGQTFDGSPDGTIQGNQTTSSVSPASGTYTFSIQPGSAALLTVNP